jgi:hypothetical protein
LGIPYPAVADGPSDHAAFSQDNRDVRLVAWDSRATNLIRGDTNGRRDVFVLRRTGQPGTLSGILSRASVATDGRQANGDSELPSLDGTTGEAPHCVAFASRATNLDRGDKSADWDVYLRDLRRHRTLLESPALTNAGEPSIDGFCRYIAFSAGVRVLIRDIAQRRTLRVARGGDPDLETDGKGVTYERRAQIYYQRLRVVHGVLARRGKERLISDTRTGGPGNGPSTNPVIDDHGRHVAFESTATDLCTDRCDFPPLYPWEQSTEQQNDPAESAQGDANGSMSDIYRRTVGTPAQSTEAMVNASYDANFGQANRPSHDPAISRAGNEIVFDTDATNAIGGGDAITNLAGQPQLFIWYWSSQRPSPAGRLRRSYTWFGSTSYRTVDASSTSPAISSRGNYIGFTSDVTGMFGESNGASIPDLFIGYAPQTRDP